jgi:iron complex transport system substrate-binding protein
VSMVALAAIVALGGCGAPVAGRAPDAARRPAASGFPVTVTDDASRTVTVAAEPERIVSLAPANTEIVFGLGRGDRLVGVTTFDDYPARVRSLPKVGDFANPNIEAIAGARPDVVLVTGGVQAEVIAKLERLGTRVVVVDPRDLDGVFESIAMAGKVLGAEPEARRLTTRMRSDLDDVRRAVGGRKPVATFVEIGWNPLFTAGKGTLLDDMVTAAGGSNVVTQSGYVGYSAEQLVKDQPYAYLGTVSSMGDPELLEGRPGYDALTAIETGRLFPLDDNLVSRPGPRVVEGVRKIAEALHPEAFGK